MAESGESESVSDPEQSFDSAAVGIALDRVRAPRGKGGRKPPIGGQGGDDAADHFLAAQEALIADQRHHLAAQFRHLGLKLWSERLKLTAQALTIAVGLLALGVVASTAWEAHEADGLVIKPFSMPPALAQRGVTGEAVASKIMDRLSAMASESNSSEVQKSIAADWGEHISIAIPETGLSLSQVDQWLREKLGHQQRLTGEISQTPDGTLEFDARVGSQALPVQTGAEGDLNKMVTRVAEAIYGREQPSSYYLYLSRQARPQEAFEFGKQRVASPDSGEQSSGYVDMAQSTGFLHGDLASIPYFEKAVATAPLVNPVAFANFARVEGELGREERFHQLYREYLRRIPLWPRFSPDAARLQETNARSALARSLGDFNAGLSYDRALRKASGAGFTERIELGDLNLAADLSIMHDAKGARRYVEGFVPASPSEALNKEFTAANLSFDAKDWAGVVAHAEADKRLLPGAQPHADITALLSIDSGETQALAHLGRFAEALALIDKTPLDCVFCLVARAVLAEAQGQTAEADRWYAETVRLTPSLPANRYYWGRARLARGDAKGALALFDAAHKLSPRYPDAIEGRGEALLALGDAKAADAAFAEAAKLAPRWGRLHLKWGEALARLGKRDEARAQFKAAAAMDLTPTDRTELTGRPR